MVQSFCGFHDLQCIQVSSIYHSSPKTSHNPEERDKYERGIYEIEFKGNPILVRNLHHETKRRMESQREKARQTSRFSLSDMPRIMSNAFLTKRFLIIRT